MKRISGEKLACYEYSQTLAMNHGFLAHAAAVLKCGRVFLFFGPSGGGKSTIAALSKNYEVISDDVVAVRKLRGSFYAFSTPWRQSGFVKTDRRANGRIAAAFFLKKSHRIHFAPLRPEETLSKIIPRQVHFFTYTESDLAGKIFYTVCDFAKHLCAYEMEFKIDIDFWQKLEEWIDVRR